MYRSTVKGYCMFSVSSLNVQLSAFIGHVNEETEPMLAEARHEDIVVICRSGLRSVLAADVMQKMGFENVKSLKTGLRGWSDYDQELVDKNCNPVHEDTAIDYFTPRLRPEQLSKK